MIELRKVTTSDKTFYDYGENLLVAAFPVEEYRDLEMQRHFTDNKTGFSNCIVFADDEPAGLLTVWDLGRFVYIEHLAVDPRKRNSGLGKAVFEELGKTTAKPIVLEVELPNDEMSRRRIGFYKRLGFELWEKEYRQPPYRANDGFLPMSLMVRGELSHESDFEEIKKIIHNEVYGYFDND